MNDQDKFRRDLQRVLDEHDVSLHPDGTGLLFLFLGGDFSTTEGLGMKGNSRGKKMLRFTQNEDNTITDNETGLTWSKETLATDVSYDDALKVLGAGWRLPTINELFSLADHARENPAIDVEAFPDTKSDWYWSSTPAAWNDSAVWVVSFNYGHVGSLHRYDCHACVRAVRAGQ